MKKILLLSHKDDVHVKSVVKYFNSKIESTYLDYEPLFNSLSPIIYTTDTNLEPSIFHTHIYDIAWFRRPSFKIPDIDKNIPKDELSYVISERNRFFDSFIYSLKINNWLNDLYDMRFAALKLNQLHIIKKNFSNVLRIPKTVITNNPSVIREQFIDKLLIKPIASQPDFRGLPVQSTVVNTTDILNTDLNIAPITMQEYIDKDYEMRVTIVGDKIFPAKIIAHSDKAKIDWRTDYPSLTYEKMELPSEVNEAMLKLNKMLNLRFSAIDLCVDKKGNIYFLEVNPNGQYLWIEEELKYPISESIAELLMSF